MAELSNNPGRVHKAIGVGSLNSLGAAIKGVAGYAGTAWPANNRAIYIPFTVDYPFVAQKMAWIVSTQSGNYDIGLYEAVSNTRLVSTGSTAQPAAGLAAADIADTTLKPGDYYMALVLSATTGLAWAQVNLGATVLESLGVKQEALGATTLPATATPAAPASAYIPAISVVESATL